MHSKPVKHSAETPKPTARPAESRGVYLGVLQRALELADSRLEPAALCPLLFHLLLHGLGPAHQRKELGAQLCAKAAVDEQRHG